MPKRLVFKSLHIFPLMKKRNVLLVSIWMMFASSVFSQNQAPVISGLTAWADVPNNTLHVFFEVADNEAENLEIFLGVSMNDTVYSVNTSGLTGDIGFPIAPGTSKEIIWNYGTSHPNILNYRVRVTADDRFQIDIQTLVDQVDTMNLYQDLQWMSAGIRDHGAGLPLLLATRDSIADRFNAFGFEVSTQEYAFLGDSGMNIIGRMPGTVEDSLTYINDAHYDGVPAGPAADDNGSGVVGFLEVARILAPYNFRKSLRFIGFDMEEDGLIGSLNYINNGGIPDWEKIEGVFNYEMIGYHSNRPNSQQLPLGFNLIFPDAADSLAANNGAGDFITNVGSDSSVWLTAQYDSISRIFVPGLRIISLVTPGNGAATQDLRRSDHAPFWDAGIEAIMLTDGANFRNLNYHTSTDAMDSLNFDFMGKNVQAVIANLCVLGGIQHSDVAYVDVAATLAVKEVNLDALQLDIYPNPSSHAVQVNVSGTRTGEEYTMEIIDEAGRLVIRQNVALTGDGISLDVSKWKAGLYNVTILGGKTPITKGLIVN